MRFMILLTANALTETGATPSEALLAEMGGYNEALAKAGVLRDAGGLQPSSKGARVRFSGANRTVALGPFPSAERMVAGYWIFEAPSRNEAIEWVKRCPNPTGDEAEIEIRQLYGPDDFAEIGPSGELRRKEAELAEMAAAASN